MALTPLEYRYGFDQGRLQPKTREVSPDDNPGPAVLVSLVPQPYALEDGETLLIAVNGAATVQVVFLLGDFVDISIATAAEVAAVLQAQLIDVVASDAGGFIQLLTTATGKGASFKVSGGLAQNVLQFPTNLVTGTQGEWSFVVGHERPGQIFPFELGDRIEVGQFGDFEDAKILRMRGHITWRGANSYTINDLPVSGFKWRVRVGPLNGFNVNVLDHSVDHDSIREFSLDDIAINLRGLNTDPHTLEFGLLLEDDSGPGGPVHTEIPAAFFDILSFPETAAVTEIGNRDPYPCQPGIPATYGDLKFTLMATDTLDITPASIRVLIEGELAYAAGAFVAPFSGSALVAGPNNHDLEFTIDFSSLAPFDSEQEINVQVDGDTETSPFHFEWKFFMVDTTAPAIVAAQGRDKLTVRAFFTEPMILDDSAVGVLNLANYTLTTLGVPAVTANIIGAVAIDTSIVDLTVDIELSFGALYELTVDSVTDLAGNVIDPPRRTVQFKGFQPPVPAGRVFSIWNMIPLFDRRRDEAIPGRPLRKFALIVQDVANLLLCEIDRWTEIIDIDLAPEPFLDAILCDLGNPFTFVDLDLNAKRRLARILVAIYKEKGTAEGIINAIRFFLGIEVEIDPINCRTFWQIGIHHLNLDTFIGPGIGSPLWYSFYIISPIILTDEQRSIMLQIATYMKAAHEHILGIIEPGADVDPNLRWIIGVSLMGSTTILSE